MLRLLIFAAFALFQSVELVKVRVNQGWLRGSARDVSAGVGKVYSFRGIPYAVPPVGKLRFKDPLPHSGWKGLRNATQHGPVCTQYDIFSEQFLNGSEDCLFLNVYTPSLKPKSPLPVMLFIHGGGWTSGSGDDADYGPDFLLPHGVILVTFNYRLDALGFLALHNKHVPGNAGMKDQVLALRWVRDNIKYFGGDREQITLMGQSAGSASVIFHMISPMSRGLFKRGIAMSGVPFSDWAQSFQDKERAFSLGKLLGKSTRDDDELLQFLQDIETNKLLGTVPATISQELKWVNPLKSYPFVPVVEKDFGQERFLIENPKEAIMKGNILDVDLMIGYTSEEFMISVPRLGKDPYILRGFDLYVDLRLPVEVLREISPRDVLPFADKVSARYFGDRPISNETTKEFIHLFNDFTFINSVYRFLRYKRDTLNTYLYKFFLTSERNRFSAFGESYGLHGCAHTDDLRYLFDAKQDQSPVDVKSEEYRFIKQVCTLFTDFAKTGNPTPSNSSLGVQWPAYDHQRKSYLGINNTMAVGAGADADIVEFWTNIYTEAGIKLP